MNQDITSRGLYGIRSENLLIIKDAPRTGPREFLAFETLNYAPFDRKMIRPTLLSERGDRLDQRLSRQNAGGNFSASEGRCTGVARGGMCTPELLIKAFYDKQNISGNSH